MTAGQNVLITGCSSGIGRALSLELARRGCQVFGSARRVETLGALTEAGGIALALDVTQPASIGAAVETMMARAGRIDMLINNAGLNVFGPLAEVPAESFARMFATNVQGVLAVTQAVFPHMAKARGGRIVNIGSVVGLLPTPFTGPYCASKAAVHMLSEVLRMEAAPFGIDVVVVQPGGVQSSIADNGSVDIARYQRAESLYHWVRDGIEKRSRASQANPMTAEDFAREVVPQLLRRRAPEVIRAGSGSLLYPALSRLPSKVRAALVSRMFKLDRRLPT